jgi:hypothetical protein
MSASRRGNDGTPPEGPPPAEPQARPSPPRPPPSNPRVTQRNVGGAPPVPSTPMPITSPIDALGHRRGTAPYGIPVVPGASAPAPSPPPQDPTRIAASKIVGIGQQPPRRPTSKFRPSIPENWVEPEPGLADRVHPSSPPQPSPDDVEPTTSPRFDRPKPHSRPPISEGLSGEIDGAFDQMLGEAAAGKFPSEPPSNLQAMKDLFAQIAGNYMRQVRDFVIELQWGEAPRDWIAICRPPLFSLLKAAEPIKIDGVCPALDAFIAELDVAAQTGERMIAGEPRERILAAYGRLAQIMPQTFALGEERNRREAIIVHALMQQIPGVGKVTIDKLYAAGLSALDLLLIARAGDVASAAGIPVELAERIVQRFARYHRELEEAHVVAGKSIDHDKLVSLVAGFKDVHDAYERIAAELPNDRNARVKRNLRTARQTALSDVQVQLARMGEVDLVRELDKLPFEKKLAAMNEHLAKPKDGERKK